MTQTEKAHIKHIAGTKVKAYGITFIEALYSIGYWESEGDYCEMERGHPSSTRIKRESGV